MCHRIHNLNFENPSRKSKVMAILETFSLVTLANMLGKDFLQFCSIFLIILSVTFQIMQIEICNSRKYTCIEIESGFLMQN